MSYKLKRISSDIIQEINKILEEEIEDEMIKNVSITDLTIDNDMTFATVYFMTRHKDTSLVEKKLNKASSFIRYNLAHKLNLRNTPFLKFVYDKSIENGENIERILKNIDEK